MRVKQGTLNIFYERVRATERAPRDPFRLLERRHGFAEVIERGAGVQAGFTSFFAPGQSAAASGRIRVRYNVVDHYLPLLRVTGTRTPPVQE